MKFLVTGANGFIGSHLVVSLQDQGHEIFKINSEKSGVLDYMLSYILLAKHLFQKAGRSQLIIWIIM